jgi:hypothetical protein
MWQKFKYAFLGALGYQWLFLVGFTHAFTLDLDSRYLRMTDPELGRVQDFLKGVSELLPHAMIQGLPESVKVQFVNFGTHPSLRLPFCVSDVDTRSDASGVDVYGQVNRKGVIELNSFFIPEILKGVERSVTYPCGHRNAYRLAMATVIHELAHIYDHSHSLLSRRVVSSDRRYQRLAGWRRKGQVVRKAVVPLNSVVLRSPDPYEFQNIEEHFAVNMEYFLLDPEYGVRRPALYSFLSEVFLGFQPYPQLPLNTRIFRHTKSGGIDRSALFDLNPDRIYQVHSFLAAPQGSFISRFGHSMLRLVICAPEREEVGPECLKDVQHHVVLSYSAYIEQAQLSSWGGMTGRYPTQAFIFPLSEVIEFYTKIDLRDLTSIPIDLTLAEKKRLIDRVLEQYWEYQSRYSIFGNNCSVEAGHLLKGVLGDELKGFKASTPLLLEEKLTELGRLDRRVLRDRKEAIRLGYLFPSIQGTLEDSFSTLQKTIKGLRWQRLEEYLRDSSAALRREEIAKLIALKQQGMTGLGKTFASFYFLESSIELNHTQRLSSVAFSELERLAQTGDDPFYQQLHEASLSKLREALPLSLLQSGYGVPQPQDFKLESPHPAAQSWDEQERKLKDWIQTRFKASYEELQAIQANKKLILPQMRRD